MQKSSCIAEISTKVAGGLLFCVHPVYVDFGLKAWCRLLLAAVELSANCATSHVVPINVGNGL